MTWNGFSLPFLAADRGGLREELQRWLGAAGAVPAPGVFPPVNIYDDGERFLVRAELPGIDKDALEVTARGNQLSIRGERVLEPADADAAYHRREREGGSFRRVVTLPQRVEGSQVSATYRDGVLEIVLPRTPEAQPRRVQIS
ncbi:MAG TPA: Hsp20/alpha crystallin family protein [Gemmatimonadota bacterium]|jgi:HSP20 family protein